MIKSRFSNAVEDYERHAIVQREAARRLADWIAKDGLVFRSHIEGDRTKGGRRLEGPLGLELGCGTGFLTTALLSHESQESGFLWEITDVSEAMLQKCQQNVSPLLRRLPQLNNRVVFRTQDINEFGATDRYDLIVSSFALQWAANPLDRLDQLAKGLSFGGQLIINLLLASSFEPWRSHVELARRDAVFFPPCPTLPSEEQLRLKLQQMVQADSDLEFEIRPHAFRAQYAGLLEFFRGTETYWGQLQNRRATCRNEARDANLERVVF